MTESGIRDGIDTDRGIQGSLDTLERLHDLIHMRMDYAQRYREGMVSEPLSEWVVLNGLLKLCDNGGVMAAVVNGKPVLEPIKGIPTVVSFKGFRRKNLEFEKIRPINIPMNGCKCPICNEGWDTLTCRQVEVKSSTESFPLNRFAGRPLVEVLSREESRTGKHYFTQCILDAAKKRVDLSLGLVVESGMLGQFETLRFLHPECAAERVSRSMKVAGFRPNRPGA